MAEVVGIVASSVQLAGLVRTIAKAGLQIQTLYQEIKDASHEVLFRLQELQILTGILENSVSISSQARDLCERCLSELHLVLAELQSQIDKSRGFRRKVASSKVIVKKCVLQKWDSRLERSVWYLMLANQSHILSMQNLLLCNQNAMSSSQSLVLHNQEAMLCLLKTHPNQSQILGQAVSTPTFERGHTKHHSVATSYTTNNNRYLSMCLEDSKVSHLAWSGAHKPTTSSTFGLPFATGTIKLERFMVYDTKSTFSKESACTEDTVPLSLPMVRVKVVLPRWLSYKSLDMVAWKAQIGWKHHLRMGNVFPDSWPRGRPVTPFDWATNIIHSGSVSQLRSCFENRELTPWDETSRGITILACAVANCRWDICDYLMDLGVTMPCKSAISETPVYWKTNYQPSFQPASPSEGTQSRVEAIENCQKFISQVDEDHIVVFSLLAGYTRSVDEFLTLRRSVWPDPRFYHPGFSLQRMLLAVAIVCELGNMWIAAPICRAVLALDSDTTRNEMHFDVHTDFGHNLFHGLAMKVGSTHGTDFAGDWHTLVRDVLRYLADVKVLNEHDPLFRCSEGTCLTMTPFLLLISEGLRARMGSYRQQATIRSTNWAAVLAGCEEAMYAWLADLYEGGIDLQLYGENEKEHFRHPEACRHQRHPSHGITYIYYIHEPQRCAACHACLYGVRLINFHYGRLPTDWQFWWSEPSDEFAGDFWRLFESRDQEALMSVPGAWVD